MKYIIFIVVSLFLFSCEITDIDYDTYTIKNETNKDVLILAYDKYYYINNEIMEIEFPNLSDSIIIKANKEYFVKKVTGEDAQPMGYFKSECDSVVLIFSDNKQLYYVCKNSYCEDNRNIVSFRNSSSKSCEKNRGCDYVYTITNDDYEQAE